MDLRLSSQIIFQDHSRDARPAVTVYENHICSPSSGGASESLGVSKPHRFVTCKKIIAPVYFLGILGIESTSLDWIDVKNFKLQLFDFSAKTKKRHLEMRNSVSK